MQQQTLRLTPIQLPWSKVQIPLQHPLVKPQLQSTRATRLKTMTHKSWVFLNLLCLKISESFKINENEHCCLLLSVCRNLENVFILSSHPCIFIFSTYNFRRFLKFLKVGSTRVLHDSVAAFLGHSLSMSQQICVCCFTRLFFLQDYYLHDENLLYVPACNEMFDKPSYFIFFNSKSYSHPFEISISFKMLKLSVLVLFVGALSFASSPVSCQSTAPVTMINGTLF